MNGAPPAPVTAVSPPRMPASRQIVSPASPSAFVVEADRDDDGLFRLTGLVGGNSVSFIVDTGATTTVLSSNDAARLGLGADGDERTSTLRTAAGTASMVWKKLARLTIAGNQVKNLDVVVVHNGLDHSLLGQDVLSQLGTITLQGNRLAIRPSRS